VKGEPVDVVVGEVAVPVPVAVVAVEVWLVDVFGGLNRVSSA